MRGPGHLSPPETFLEQVDWHEFSSKLQVRQNDLKDVFCGLVRNCMPVRFRGKTLSAVLAPEHNAITAQFWSKWFGKAVRILVGKHGDQALSPTGEELHSYHLETAVGLALPVEEPFEAYL